MSDKTPSTDDTMANGAQPDGFRVTVPGDVEAKIRQRLPETEFDSVDAYVTFVLESVLRELDEQHEGAVFDDGVDDGAEGSDAIQERLESLGYL